MKKWLPILLSIIATNCSDFLDLTPTNSELVDTYFNQNHSSLQNIINGCYDDLIQPSYYGRNFRLMFDLYSGNLVLNNTNSNRFTAFNYRNINANNQYINKFWSQGYKIINNCNKVLYTIQKNTYSDSVLINYLKAQALSIRSLVYFDLVKTFSLHFSSTDNTENANGNGGHKGIPIADVIQRNDSRKSPERNSVKETYDYIISSLQEAMKYAEGYNSDPYSMSKEYLWGLLAKIHLQKRDYIATIQYCDSIIQSNKFSLLTTENYFEMRNSAHNPENIFCLSTYGNNLGTESLEYFLDINGYTDAVATNDLVSLFKETDIRTMWFNSSKPYTISKFNVIPGTNGNIICLLNYSEVELMVSEALISLVIENKVKDEFIFAYEDEAQRYLNNVKKRTSSVFIPTNSTGETLLNEILQERRREFCCEGEYFFDLKRNKKDISITDCNSTCIIEYNSPKFAMPIPITEINANRNISQNYSY